MNVVFTVINSFDEIDYDDLWERSYDAIENNWPENAPISKTEAKQHIKNMIQSGLDDEWPGLNPHAPGDNYVFIKYEDTDSGLLLGAFSGFITADGVLDGRHSFSTPDATGSRNYLYTQPVIEARHEVYRQLGITQVMHSSIPKDSVLYRFLKLRANAGNYTIVRDEEVLPNFMTVVIQPNL